MQGPIRILSGWRGRTFGWVLGCVLAFALLRLVGIHAPPTASLSFTLSTAVFFAVVAAHQDRRASRGPHQAPGVYDVEVIGGLDARGED
jgi:hypothetical protein